MFFFNILFCISYAFSVTCHKQNYNVTAVSPAGGLVLKSPRWSVEENALYWVDSIDQTIHRLDSETGEITTRKVAYGPVNMLVPVKDTPGYIVVGVRSGLYLLKWGAPGGDRALRLLTAVDLGRPDNLIDEGGADAKGRLWFGTVSWAVSDSKAPTKVDGATLYVITSNDYENPRVKLRPLSLSNSVTWSPDNNKMYHVDTLAKKVYAFDFDLHNGDIANKTILFDFVEEGLEDIPDGMTIDSEGHLWVASFYRAKLMIIDGTSGKLIDELELPVDQVSSATWGGPDFKTLYVTTASWYIETPKPLTGALLAIKNTGYRGIAGNTFIFPDAANY